MAGQEARPLPQAASKPLPLGEGVIRFMAAGWGGGLHWLTLDSEMDCSSGPNPELYLLEA